MRTLTAIAAALTARIDEAIAATAHLKNYPPEYIEVIIQASPGEPPIYSRTACSAADIQALLAHVRQTLTVGDQTQGGA